MIGEPEADYWRLHRVPEIDGPFQSSDPLLARWYDLSEREERLGIRPGQFFLLRADGEADSDVLEFFRTPGFTRLAKDTQMSYARDLKVHFEFLESKGKSWRNADHGDLADYEFWRLRDTRNPKRVSGSKFNRELAACRKFYEFQVRRQVLSASPILLENVRRRDGTEASSPSLRSANVRSSRVNWLTPAAYRLWSKVGLGGYRPDGLPDTSWKGRNDGRNLAFTELLWASGLRLREAGSLLLTEVPSHDGRQRYLRGRLARSVAKGGSGRDFWVSANALDLIESYVASTRQFSIDRARAEGRYKGVEGMRIVTRFGGKRQLSYRDQDGTTGRVSLDQLDAEERLRLYWDGPSGLEPLALWLGESGLPMPHVSWQAVFQAANARCERFGLTSDAGPIRCRAHMLRHSFALRMLITLQHLFDRRLNLTPDERKEYRFLFGDPWVMVKELLGHKSIETTRDTYLVPATGLQLEFLLNGEPEDASEITLLLSDIAERSGLVHDITEASEVAG